MIDGLNDTDEQADGLVELARGWRSHVNLIPLNPTPGSRWSGTPAGRHRALRRRPAGRRRHRSRCATRAAARSTRPAASSTRSSPDARCARRARRWRRRRPRMSGEPQISASILNADFASLGDEVRRAADGGVDSIHLDVMDGHFVDNLTIGPVVVEALRPVTDLPFHSHLMITNPLAYAERFADAGSDLIVFHVEADDDPGRGDRRDRAAGQARRASPSTPRRRPRRCIPYLERVDLLLVMTVHPGWGGQAFIGDVLPKLARAARRDRPSRAGRPDRRRWRSEPRDDRRGARRRRRGARRRQGPVQ